MPPFNAPSWKQLAKRYDRDAKFGRPATEKRLLATERACGAELPTQLREFLREANGMIADLGCHVIWSDSEIESRNREMRTYPGFPGLCVPFDGLLFFGDDGGGDLFAYAIHADGKIHKHDVFRWDHETDGRSWFAGGLGQFLEWRLKRDEVSAN